MVNLVDYTFEEGTPNIGGVWEVGVCKRTDVQSITNGIITLKAGKRMNFFTVTDQKNVYTWEDTSTEADITGFNQKLAFSFAGLSEAGRTIAQALQSGEFVFVFREAGDCENAEWFYVGLTCKGARKSKNAGGTGTASGDYKGHDFEFSLMGADAPYNFLKNADPLLLFGIPSPPVIGVSAITTTGFTVNWAVVSGAAGYRLDVSTSNTFATFVAGFNDNAIAGGGTTSRAVTGLTTGTTYYYRLRTIDANGTVSVNSSTFTATTS